jgi:hypothetical protein
MAFGGKYFGAVVAFEWLFLGVASVMYVHVAFFSK